MKNILRKKYKQIRREMTKEEVHAKSLCACKNFINSDLYKNSKTLMLYMAIYNETDTGEIIKKALEDNKITAFPVTDEESGVITAYYADVNTDYKKGAFSIREPQNSSVAHAREIDTVIVPGIAFCKNGKRIGFGKGCYDRFFEKCNGLKIGFCFEKQICDDFHCEEHDIKMDYIVTEERIINCKEQ